MKTVKDIAKIIVLNMKRRLDVNPKAGLSDILQAYGIYEFVKVRDLARKDVIKGNPSIGYTISDIDYSINNFVFYFHTSLTHLKSRQTIPESENIVRSFKHLSLRRNEYNSLTSQYGKTLTDDILDRIENYPKNKKYSSLYLTAKNWLSREIKKPELENKPVVKNEQMNLFEKMNNIINDHVKEKTVELNNRITTLESDVDYYKKLKLKESYFKILGFNIKINHIFGK